MRFETKSKSFSVLDHKLIIIAQIEAQRKTNRNIKQNTQTSQHG